MNCLITCADLNPSYFANGYLRLFHLPPHSPVIPALSDALKLVGQAYIALSGGASFVRHRPAWPNLAKFTFSARDGVEAGANMVWEGSIDT